MVAQNLILVRESLLFIPNASEQENKSNQNGKKDFDITCILQQKMNILKPFLLQPTLKQSSPAHSYITGIYRNNFNTNI
jgi:hypothetical protein